MNRHEEDLISQWMNRAHPPEVAPGEWNSIYRGILLNAARSAESRTHRPLALLRWAVAAAFVAGVGLGLLLSRSPVSSSLQPLEKGSVDRTNLPIEELPIVPLPEFEPVLAASQPEGPDMFGLKNVRIEAQSPIIMGARYCQISAETPRGIKVVWNYVAQEDRDIDLGG